VAFDVARVAGKTRRRELHESGSLRVRFPSPEDDGLSAVFVNTAGGVAGGDHFGIDIAVAEDARLTVTTAAAEKVYRSHGPASRLDIRLDIADGAHLSWMPQETILFDQARVERAIEIDLAAQASLLLCEIIVFGRVAMGETMRSGHLIDRWRVRRAGKIVFAETTRLGEDIAGILERPAVAAGGLAIGTVLIAPGDEALIERLRIDAPASGCEMGVSAWNGFALARFCGQDAATLRATIVALLQAAGTRLPRLWSS
jgi:urease accessory protein